MAEEEDVFPAGYCLSQVTGEGRTELGVRLSRVQPVPLVSVLSVLSQSLQDDMLYLSCHITIKLQVV